LEHKVQPSLTKLRSVIAPLSQAPLICLIYLPCYLIKSPQTQSSHALAYMYLSPTLAQA